jgi:hypothetical protein
MGCLALLALLLFLVFAPVLTQGKNVIIMVDKNPCRALTKNQMRKFSMKYLALLSSGKVSRLGALYDDDALLVTSNGKAIYGSTNIQRYYNDNKDYPYFSDANSAMVRNELFFSGCNVAQYSVSNVDEYLFIILLCNL